MPPTRGVPGRDARRSGLDVRLVLRGGIKKSVGRLTVIHLKPCIAANFSVVAQGPLRTLDLLHGKDRAGDGSSRLGAAIWLVHAARLLGRRALTRPDDSAGRAPARISRESLGKGCKRVTARQCRASCLLHSRWFGATSDHACRCSSRASRCQAPHPLARFDEAGAAHGGRSSGRDESAEPRDALEELAPLPAVATVAALPQLSVREPGE